MSVTMDIRVTVSNKFISKFGCSNLGALLKVISIKMSLLIGSFLVEKCSIFIRFNKFTTSVLQRHHFHKI